MGSDPKHLSVRPPRFRPPGFFECRRAIESLKRFQNLARHHIPIYPDREFAPKLSELLPPGTKREHEQGVIEQQINRLTLVVGDHLRRAGIDAAVTVDEWETRTDDLVAGYLELTRGQGGYETQRMLMALLESALGFYEARKKAALREMFNPLNWIAGLLRIPIAILERAGVEEASSWIVKAYAWMLRIGLLLLVIFGAAKLGISIPWKEVAGLFR